ncbi:MAG: hypothetical protein AAF196_11435 [Planctomycetota bacterium]
MSRTRVVAVLALSLGTGLGAWLSLAVSPVLPPSLAIPSQDTDSVDHRAASVRAHAESETVRNDEPTWQAEPGTGRSASATDHEALGLKLGRLRLSPTLEALRPQVEVVWAPGTGHSSLRRILRVPVDVAGRFEIPSFASAAVTVQARVLIPGESMLTMDLGVLPRSAEPAEWDFDRRNAGLRTIRGRIDGASAGTLLFEPSHEGGLRPAQPITAFVEAGAFCASLPDGLYRVRLSPPEGGPVLSPVLLEIGEGEPDALRLDFRTGTLRVELVPGSESCALSGRYLLQGADGRSIGRCDASDDGYLGFENLSPGLYRIGRLRWSGVRRPGLRFHESSSGVEIQPLGTMEVGFDAGAANVVLVPILVP